MQIRPGIYIDKARGKGRGVFTKRKIAKGTTVEESPVIVMEEGARKHIDQTILLNYIFEWQPDGKNLSCMAMGYVPVYNHAYKSNCEYEMDYETDIITIRAVRDIEAGEELTINYNGDWNNQTEIWFEVKK